MPVSKSPSPALLDILPRLGLKFLPPSHPPTMYLRSQSLSGFEEFCHQQFKRIQHSLEGPTLTKKPANVPFVHAAGPRRASLDQLDQSVTKLAYKSLPRLSRPSPSRQTNSLLS